MRAVYVVLSALCFAAIAHCQEEKTGTDDYHRPTGDYHDRTPLPGHHRDHTGHHHPTGPPRHGHGTTEQLQQAHQHGSETGPHQGSGDDGHQDGHDGSGHHHSDTAGKMDGENGAEGKTPDQGGKKDGDKHDNSDRKKKAILAGILILGSVLVIVGVVFAVRRYRRRKRTRQTTQAGVKYSHFADDRYGVIIQDGEAVPLTTNEKI